MGLLNESDSGFINNNISTRQSSVGVSSLPVFQAKLAIVVLDNLVALAGGVFKFLAVHDLHCATGVLDELLPLQNTSCQAHGWSIRPEHRCEKIMSDGQRP